MDFATPEEAGVRHWLQTVPSPFHSPDEFGRSRCVSPSTPPAHPTDEDLSASYSNTTDRGLFDRTVSTTLYASPASSATSLSDYRSCVASVKSTPCKPHEALASSVNTGPGKDGFSVHFDQDEECDSPAAGSEAQPEVVREEECYPNLNNATTNNPKTLRVILVTSCLHCVLAKLPCSRTLPACSRCVRNGRLCLPQRRRMNTELVRGDTIGNVLPIPFYLPDDDAETRGRKVALYDELMSFWKAEQDKKNWVLPTEGRLGGFPGRWWVKREPRHPGEGTGTVTYQAVRTRRPG
ncbi:uncharacterized protein BDZ99DRAFT_292206 [Mytilinidion resinicola]|uniref:Zn(2)-C6 fungal-type domain-containing protein n=1 Tax=Mytilinidion resinicola TaxID=574789 RepID=A0A6A6YSD7_9PEZI|nr:uncharacterized protein BDZ99DRAFT_292206 [Mytilinidion resinicola]KAF2810964.1 hypothetical protein BDZ99DRAFT_292206 [Mytilinidion resinicola]